MSLLLVPAPMGAKVSSPSANVSLSNEHRNATESFRFRTPATWTVETLKEGPELLEARGDGVLVRFLHRQQEVGYDGLHADCMLERLTEAMDMQPQVRYEYDFVSWEEGPRRLLDSAFEVTYDKPVLGQKQWRQRNLTVVGDGQSLCVITYCPAPMWKKSAETRTLLDAVVKSVEFGPWR